MDRRAVQEVEIYSNTHEKLTEIMKLALEIVVKDEWKDRLGVG